MKLGRHRPPGHDTLLLPAVPTRLDIYQSLYLPIVMDHWGESQGAPRQGRFEPPTTRPRSPPQLSRRVNIFEALNGWVSLLGGGGVFENMQPRHVHRDSCSLVLIKPFRIYINYTSIHGQPTSCKAHARSHAIYQAVFWLAHHPI